MTPNKIAVTGGIGSGKSLFCDILSKMGYPVFSCDEINRALWQDKDYLHALAIAFPDCLSDGAPQKEMLSRKVFSDREARKKLDRIAHPRIMRRLLEAMNACEGPVFAEVPLLFEGGYEGLFDAVIALRRNQEERIAALCARDSLSREAALERMQAQFAPDRLEEKNCIIIENDGDSLRLEQKARHALRALGIL